VSRVRAARAIGVVALVLGAGLWPARPARANDAPPPAALAPLVDELGAATSQALAEMRGEKGQKLRVAVTPARGAGALAAPLRDWLIASTRRGPELEVHDLPDADLATVQRAGYDLWVELELRVDEAAAKVTLLVRVRRPSLAWRDWLSWPMKRWVRSFAASRPLDAELRRVLHLPTRGARVLGKPRRVELDLGAPLLALATADLDHDGKVEIVALTTDEVVVLQAKKDTLVARQRFALRSVAPVPRPREPIGTIVTMDLDGDGTPEIIATSSEHQDGQQLAWRKGALVDAGAFHGFPVCPLPYDTPAVIGALPLVPGRNVFDGRGYELERDRGGEGAASHAFPPESVAATCAGEARDDRYTGNVAADGRFALARYAGPVLATVTGVGAAIALADLDGDHLPELVASAPRPPGDGDQLTIYGFTDAPKPTVLWRSEPLSGGIVAVTTGDTDGDGVNDVIFAARLLGATRTDAWIVR
jgi:hypothetical protein